MAGKNSRNLLDVLRIKLLGHRDGLQKDRMVNSIIFVNKAVPKAGRGGKPVKVKQVSEELGVRYVLDGGV